MGVTVYYEKGQVVKMLPEPKTSYYEVRELINEATAIVSDGVHYDLTNRDSIYSIAVPKYTSEHENENAQNLGVTGYLDYVLRMHAGFLWKTGDYNLAMVCLGKACQLMLYSTIDWQRKDYYRVVQWNVELGRFKKAKEWQDWIEKYTEDPNDYAKNAFIRTIETCKFLKTDLVEVGDSCCCCEVCAKYRKRIYSLSGRSFKYYRFPKNFHFECCLSISPFVAGISEPSFQCSNYVRYSKRPFRDDRTPEEIENYKKHIAELEKAKDVKQTADLNHIIYYWFKSKFPNDFPKTLNAFSRMRNANSPKYQKLVQLVEDAGYRIPQSLEEITEIDEKNNKK